ncbi:MAG: hypothetical protein JXR53_06060 [Bacteroidales bacterium]|nr:hypothetical protein [Bacteroidales bacterium]
MVKIKTIASEDLLMEQLQNRDWEQYWLRLLGRCYWILRNRYEVKWPNDRLKDFSRSVVGEVINKIFIEKIRNWNIERYPDFDEFIVGVIDSHINNIFNKKDNQTNVGDNEFILNESIASELDTEETMIGSELRKQIFVELQDAGAEDDELLIFECLADGIIKPVEIKKEIGLSDEDFHNAWRRFKRRREIIQINLAANGY